MLFLNVNDGMIKFHSTGSRIETFELTSGEPVFLRLEKENIWGSSQPRKAAPLN